MQSICANTVLHLPEKLVRSSPTAISPVVQRNLKPLLKWLMRIPPYWRNSGLAPPVQRVSWSAGDKGRCDRDRGSGTKSQYALPVSGWCNAPWGTMLTITSYSCPAAALTCTGGQFCEGGLEPALDPPSAAPSMTLVQLRIALTCFNVTLNL